MYGLVYHAMLHVRFPVQMTVMSPDGVVLGSENANSFMSAVEKEHGFDDWGNEE